VLCLTKHQIDGRFQEHTIPVVVILHTGERSIDRVAYKKEEAKTEQQKKK
jgi:hypothetical protein